MNIDYFQIVSIEKNIIKPDKSWFYREDVEYFPDGKFEFKYEMDLEEEKFELIQVISMKWVIDTLNHKNNIKYLWP